MDPAPLYESKQDDYRDTIWKIPSHVYHTFSFTESETIPYSSYKLLPHQTSAVGWLRKREENPPHGYTHRGGILADDMGLGKTIQMLALIAMDKFEREKVEFRYDYKHYRHNFTEYNAPHLLSFRQKFSSFNYPILFV